MLSNVDLSSIEDPTSMKFNLFTDPSEDFVLYWSSLILKSSSVRFAMVLIASPLSQSFLISTKRSKSD